jgi:hypothetical protein
MERLARLDPDNWELESALTRHQRAPRTFQIPSQEARSAVRVGQAVKLVFRIRVTDERGSTDVVTERMWVYVTGREAERYVGRLQNQPECTPDLAPGTVVHFLADHIADISDPPAGYEPV